MSLNFVPFLFATPSKVVSKVIVNQLKEHINVLISLFQTGFISGRNIHENIIVAQELIHSLRRMKNKKGGLVIKVDLAYDRLKRMKDTLNSFCNMSGHMVSVEKMTILFAKCVTQSQNIIGAGRCVGHPELFYFFLLQHMLAASSQLLHTIYCSSPG